MLSGEMSGLLQLQESFWNHETVVDTAEVVVEDRRMF